MDFILFNWDALPGHVRIASFVVFSSFTNPSFEELLGFLEQGPRYWSSVLQWKVEALCHNDFPAFNQELCILSP